MEKERWKNIEHGDIAAYSEAYVFYYNKLYNYGRKFTDNTALIEDAVQCVFIMLWNDRQKLAAVHSPASYIFCSFRNFILHEKKKVQKIDSPENELVFAVEDAIVIRETNVELNKRLQKALGDLTSRQREAIFLRFYEGLSYEEVSQVIGISVKATYKLVARALLSLKELMNMSMVLVLAFLNSLLLLSNVSIQILT